MSDKVNGQCLCGGVAFSIPLQEHVETCHCRMCNRWSGGPFIDMQAKRDSIMFERDSTLVWYDSSEWAERGFCGTCGSNLFYRMKQGDSVAVLAGSLDLPPGIALKQEIFIDEKPDYYDLAGDRPRLTGAEVIAQFQEDQS